MFLLHERTRKALCRLGFLTVCLLPTCAVALWAASRNGEAHRGRCEAELGRLLQLKVTLLDVEYPEPDVARYTHFLLADPETERPIVSAARIEVRKTPTALTIMAPELRVEASAESALAELVHDRLRDRSESGAFPVSLSVEKVIVASPSGDVTLLNVRGLLGPTSEGRGAEVRFHTAEMTKDSQPVVLTIVRSHDARIGFKLETHGAFNEPADRSGPIVRLLRTFVANQPVLVPFSREAEALMRFAPSMPE